MTMTLLLALAFQASADRDPLNHNCADPQTQTDMNACAGIDFRRADADLNAAYRDAIAMAQRRDRDRSAGERDSDARPGYEAVLRAAQRAWLTYRDQHCTWVGYNDARGGTMEPMSYSSCLAGVTRERIAELREGAEEH
jgi:uncharacterized protein YecT (DUF1311 family)